jgi:hypothetical protein
MNMVTTSGSKVGVTWGLDRDHNVWFHKDDTGNDRIPTNKQPEFWWKIDRADG